MKLGSEKERAAAGQGKELHASLTALVRFALEVSSLLLEKYNVDSVAIDQGAEGTSQPHHCSRQKALDFPFS